MAREKAGDCNSANTTYDIVMCLEKANETTDANYREYEGALHAMLAIPTPSSTSRSEPATSLMVRSHLRELASTYGEYLSH
jgi:hypothetical protein